jgi:hypothetical protein
MADQDALAPLISGDDWNARLFINNQRFGEDLLVTMSVKTNATIYTDAHGGNKTDKVDVRVWHYDFDLKFHYKTDRMLQAVLKYYASKRIAGSTAIVVGIALFIQDRSPQANLPGYLLSPCGFNYDLSLPGMKERLTQGVSGKAETFEPYVVTK